MEHEPVKIRPDLWYVVLCAAPPAVYKEVTSLIGVFNELVAPEFPYSKSFYLVVAWQRGLGAFSFHWRLSNEDGKRLLQAEPTEIIMELAGNELTMPYKLEVHAPGLYLIEGFLDDAETFKTTFRVSRRTQE